MKPIALILIAPLLIGLPVSEAAQKPSTKVWEAMQKRQCFILSHYTKQGKHHMVLGEPFDP